MADVLSAPITVADLARVYDDLAHRRRPDPTPGSYLDFAREERSHNLTVHAQDEGLRHSKDFLAGEADFYPAFPLDRGIQAGHCHQPVNRTHSLLSGDRAEQLETACRQAGGTLFTGHLAAMAASVRDEGGSDNNEGALDHPAHTPAGQRNPWRPSRAPAPKRPAFGRPSAVQAR
ncbi:hypothetical protein [Streptomyces erythrochromogenes]|uniref:hypothetical protein n=1 Tax=Streptomyces erythrochromogenes TaxID=285574 RepID=UPI00386ABB23|nr:hypothetical protein OG364_38335 [Streptomyces erythrochromogenes]